eukprot:542953_1
MAAEMYAQQAVVDEYEYPKTQLSMVPTNSNNNHSYTSCNQPTDEDNIDTDRSSSSIGEKLRKKRNICNETCFDSCVLQLKSTPYKSRIVQMEGYKINKQNRKWITSIILAITLVLIAFIGGTINLINFKTGKICKSSPQKVDKYLDDYKNITNYYYNKPIGDISKNITMNLYTIAIDKYSYKYVEWQENKTISKTHLFENIFKNNTNLTSQCYTGSSSCFNILNNQSYTCWDNKAKCIYINKSSSLASIGTKWPTPHKHSEQELRENSKKDCTQKICWDGWGLKVICKTITYPCPISIDSTGLFLEGEFDKSLFSNFSQIDYEKAANTANDLLWEIYQRATFIASFYCLYMALMIFLGAPYIITSPRITTKMRYFLNQFTKIWFIVLLLFIWYSSEILGLLWKLLVIDTDLLIILKYATIDPCFADITFMTQLFKGGKDICKDLTYSKSLYDASISNLIYYESVENTYEYYYFADDEYITNNPDEDIRYEYSSDMDRIFYQYDEIDILKTNYNISYDINASECDISNMFDYIGPNDANVNVTSLILFSSAVAALLLQPILANLIKSIIVMIDPLAPFWGRIEMPYQHMNDDNDKDNINSDDNDKDKHEANGNLPQWKADIANELEYEQDEEDRKKKVDTENEELAKIMNYVIKWERTKNFCPLLCWIILFILIVINLISSCFI